MSGRKKLMLFIFAVVPLCLFFGYSWAEGLYRYAFSESERTVSEHVALLEPHLEVLKPAEEGVFPVVVVVPGCLHTVSHNSAWHSFFVELGYAVVVVDSFAPRGIVGTDAMLQRVCSGRKVAGFDRAGDVYAAVEYLRQQPWADSERIILAGWSHGGWAVMDAMAFYSDNAAPYNLAGSGDGLAGVSGIVLVYPYCGFGTAVRSGFSWEYPIPVLQIIAGSDAGVDPKRCVHWSDTQDSLSCSYGYLRGSGTYF